MKTASNIVCIKGSKASGEGFVKAKNQGTCCSTVSGGKPGFTKMATPMVSVGIQK